MIAPFETHSLHCRDGGGPGLATLALAGVGLGLFLASRGPGAGSFSFRGRTVVVTGGSRGLGLVMARKLAAEGAKIALIARSGDDLQRAEEDLRRHGAEVMHVACDVSDREAANDAIDRIIGRFGRIDVLVNNAGIIQVGPLAHMEVEDFERALDVHFRGPLYLTLAVLPHLRKAGGGRIVNISSVGGELAAPHLVPYSASKFALVGLSEGLAAELRNENIFVTTVCPGLMRTGSPPNARFKGRHRKEYAWFAIADSLPLVSMSAERAAEKILAACRRGTPHVTLGLQTKAAVYLGRTFPGLKTRLSALATRLLPDPDPSAGTASHSGYESESRFAPSVLTKPTYAAAQRNNEAR